MVYCVYGNEDFKYSHRKNFSILETIGSDWYDDLDKRN